MSLDELESVLRDRYERSDFGLEVSSEERELTPYGVQPTPEGGWQHVRELRIPLPDGQVVLTLAIRPQLGILRALQNRYVFALTLVFLLTLCLIVLVIMRALHPLRRLAETCAAISAGQLRSVSTRGASGEIRALEETFNDMVHSLREKEMMADKLRQAQRLSALGNLAAGVAHDIRNPLNAIKLLSRTSFRAFFLWRANASCRLNRTR